MNQPSEPKLETRLRGVLRVRHYSRHSEETYAGWYRRYVLFHKKRLAIAMHPAEKGAY